MTHDIGWAVRQMKAGKRVRRNSWRDKRIYIDSEQYDPMLEASDLLATNWEIYKETKWCAP